MWLNISLCQLQAKSPHAVAIRFAQAIVNLLSFLISQVLYITSVHGSNQIKSFFIRRLYFLKVIWIISKNVIHYVRSV